MSCIDDDTTVHDRAWAHAENAAAPPPRTAARGRSPGPRQRAHPGRHSSEMPRLEQLGTLGTTSPDGLFTMRKHHVLVAFVACVAADIAGLPHVVLAQAPTALALGAGDPLARFTVQIAPRAALVEDKDARDTLSSLLDALDRRNAGGGDAGVDTKALVELQEFAQTHRRTRAALTAKFLIARGLLKSATAKERDAGKVMLESISRDYSGTLEATISQIEFLGFAGEATRDSPDERRAILRKSRDVIEAALPQLREIDESHDKITIRLRRVLSPKDGDLMPSLTLAIGGLCADLGEWDRALKAYESVVKEYAGTQYAEYAKRLIEAKHEPRK